MDDSSSKLLLVAAASAAASSLLTYAVFRLHAIQASERQEEAPASPAVPAAASGGSQLLAAPLNDPHDPSPRSDYLSWDDYFMAVAFLSAQRSKDPNKQVGACIVDQNQVICGIGYNGFPRGCSDSELPWAKKSVRGDPLETKYPYVCHAEMNAILNKNGASVAGAKVFVTMFPCNECAKLMIQAGIREIVYHEDKDQPPRSGSPTTGGFNRDQQYTASRKLLALAGVRLRQHVFRMPVVLRLTNDARQQPMAAAGLGTSSSGGGKPIDSGSGGIHESSTVVVEEAGCSGTVPADEPAGEQEAPVAVASSVAAASAAAAAAMAPAVAAVLQNGSSSSSSDACRPANGATSQPTDAAGAAAAAAAAALGGRRRRKRGRKPRVSRHEQQQQRQYEEQQRQYEQDEAEVEKDISYPFFLTAAPLSA